MKAHIGVTNGTDIGSSDPINVGYQTNGWYKLSTHPLYFTRAGRLWSDEYRYTTTYLSYWSATSYNGSDAYSLVALSGILYPAGSDSRAYGFSVRCVVSCHAAEGSSVVAVVAVRRPYATGKEVQVVSPRRRNSSTRPVAGVPSKVVKRRAIHVAGTDKVVRISINERIAIRSVGSISRAAKVCTGGKGGGFIEPVLTVVIINNLQNSQKAFIMVIAIIRQIYK